MKKENFFNRVSELKDKFVAFFQHRKKVSALENYSLTGRFEHRNYLGLVKECLNDGFLGDEESKFLDHMLGRYEMHYLDWAHRTRWLKTEVSRLKIPEEKPTIFQSTFGFEQPTPTLNIPMALIAKQSAFKGKRV